MEENKYSYKMPRKIFFIYSEDKKDEDFKLRQGDHTQLKLLLDPQTHRDDALPSSNKYNLGIGGRIG